jgi:glycosyltransferase involved in cell wall biosynthesis
VVVPDVSRILAPAPPAGLVPSGSRPTFSIVVPTYQAAATIADAVGSALAQSYAAHEVVVVDDGSTDDLERALEPFRDRIVLVRKQNGGGASALNAGMAAAAGEFLAILDSDDAYHPRRLEVLARLAEDRPDLDVITTDAQFIVDGVAVGRFAEANPFAVTGQRTAILRNCFVGGWPAVRLARLRAVGGFDESFRVA